MSALCGSHDEHLARLEQKLGVSIHAKGNRLTIRGDEGAASATVEAINALYERITGGDDVTRAEVDAAIRFAQNQMGNGKETARVSGPRIKTPRRDVEARSPGQAAYINALMENELVFGLGPAGTGKTYIAVAMGVSLMQTGQVSRLILSRPAVEAGERLGFLPGDLKDKVDPYLRPLYDALYEMLPADRVTRLLENGEIEVAPLAFMRGRTLSNAFIILDEAQNTTQMQMKMLLTRLGENSRMVVTGDLSQIDLPSSIKSGLREATEVLSDVEGVSFIRFGHKDVVRHDLVAKIVQAYDNSGGSIDKKPKGTRKTATTPPSKGATK